MLVFSKKNSDGSVDFIGKQGATWSLVITVKDKDGNPVDLTGYLVRGQVRKSHKATTAWNFDCSIVDAQGGKILVMMDAEDTASIPVGDSSDPKSANNTYVYDIELESPQGQVVRILEGKIYVDPEVTK